jgi:hypothetical protein
LRANLAQQHRRLKRRLPGTSRPIDDVVLVRIKLGRSRPPWAVAVAVLAAGHGANAIARDARLTRDFPDALAL